MSRNPDRHREHRQTKDSTQLAPRFRVRSIHRHARVSSVDAERGGWITAGRRVFTHAIKLSHPLEQLNAPGTVIQWEDFEPYEGDFDPRHIARPVFGRGQEIMVYRDSAHLHSAPDVSHREAVWRFM